LAHARKEDGGGARPCGGQSGGRARCVREALAALVLAVAVVPAGGRAAESEVQEPRPVTSTLRGRVDMRRDPGPVARRPAIADVAMPGPRDQPDRRRAVVYLETAPKGAFEDREGGRAVLDQRNETFVPHILAVTVGTVVDFRNDDRTYHNVFSLSKAKRFDLGRYAAGQSKSVRFDRPGVVRVFCDIHSHMNAFIVVFAHRFFAVTGPDGDYRIDGIPPGTYSVAVWHPVLSGETRSVRITEGGGDTELDFTLQ
jgi:plastocyanin